MTQPIRFFHRGDIVEVDDVAPTRSVLDWLRETARLTGTKEGCNEGDCGACTVVIGELPEHTDGCGNAGRPLGLRTVNACIQFMPTLNGKALFTVEDLKSIGGDDGANASHAAQVPALHPVQQAMVDCHASQCGFCTPGFVMSLWSAYERHAADGTRPSRQALADEIAGNLCRCTGYRPILDAGERMFDLPAVRLDSAAAVAALKSIARDGTFSYTGPAGTRLHAPRTLAALAALRETLPQARMLGGATDIGLWVNKQFRAVDELIYVGDVVEMKRIEERDGHLVIGAGASLEAAWSALVARVPSLADVWQRFASPPIRHAGTMGGNVANGSPIGDAPPVLVALDAQVELRRGERVRRLLLADFYVDYMQNRLEPGEFVTAIAVPLAAMAGSAQPHADGPGTPSRAVRAWKISKRFDSDISAVLGAFAITLDGGVVGDVRLVFGGMAATCRRAPAAETALLGRPWTEATVEAAQAALARDFTPLTDVRASAGYRMQVAQNLLRRLWLETRAGAPAGDATTSVRAARTLVVRRVGTEGS